MTDRAYPVIVVELSEEDGGGFLAIAPDLPGCMGDGATREDAVGDFARAKAEWVDEAKRLNRKVPQPGSSFVMAAEENNKMKALVKAQETLIKQQEALIREKDQHLNEAKKEIARITRSIGEAHTTALRGHVEFYAWHMLGAMPAAVAEQIANRKHPSRRLN